MKTHSAAGFSLLEVAIATGIAAFCLLTLFGLLPIGLTQTQGASAQTAAAHIASELTGDLQLIGKARHAVSPRFGLRIPPAGSVEPEAQTFFLAEDGTATAPGEPATGAQRYRASVWFTPPSRAASRGATFARIVISWPAAADPDPQQPATHSTGSFEAITAFDRN